MLAFLNQVRKPTLDLPLDVRRKMWFKPFMQSYLVVFIGYLTMYLIRKNFNIAQNDMISTYGLSMTQLGMIGLGFSITYGVGKTLVSYYADGKNTKQFLPFMLILSAICMLGFSASMGAGSTSLFLMIAFYALSGFFCALAGVVYIGRLNSAVPLASQEGDLDAIASCIIGGASFLGGKGNVWGTLIGAFMITVIRNGCNLLGVSSDLQLIVIGAIIIAAVFVDVVRSRMEANAKRLAVAKAEEKSEK